VTGEVRPRRRATNPALLLETHARFLRHTRFFDICPGSGQVVAIMVVAPFIADATLLTAPGRTARTASKPSRPEHAALSRRSL
jgi:hypothetical protein